ncbi:DUF1993 family protein [Vibrio sp. SCSIO 43132]|uniref:DUF1993 family protein n=1 Tax=Vibrio sp. SCSIO 43132 TaxID=2779363 RepID=UPI001CA9A009|nr:DUF1993 family protein [Vibrio sp. SCSIO 43132]UAB73027.1 DUF1993 family protein [Vibrio sp. SCSIO 43132]
MKKVFTRYLTQLKVILLKVPSDTLQCSLSEGMFPLEAHAKIATNFALRGYCPLLGVEVISFDQRESGLASLITQIDETLSYLKQAPDIKSFDDNVMLQDRAGFADVSLPQSEFISLYIVPNLLFHMSMVYAIAKSNGVELGKGDFDGLHQYPKGFHFVK